MKIVRVDVKLEETPDAIHPMEAARVLEGRRDEFLALRGVVGVEVKVLDPRDAEA